MSNGRGGRALRAPIFSAARFFALPGQDCALCAASARDSLVCARCAAALARPGTRCRICAVALPEDGICGRCKRRAPAFDSACAAFEYRFPLDRLVQRFKYSGDLAIGRWLALEVAERVAEEPRPDLVVAPPLAPARLRSRGFNQAIEIAKVVARRIGARCALSALTKSRETAPQPGLARGERLANLRGAFRCTLELRGLHVALVDDVMTTGATAEAIARVLKGSGAASVRVWAVARTPDPSQRD